MSLAIRVGTGLLDVGVRTYCSAVETLIGRRSTVLIFHRVLEEADPLSPSTPDADTFERLMRQVQRQFDVVALSDIVDGIERGVPLSRAVAITFDDGYADNVSVAAPILKRLEMTATFFVSTGYLDGGVMWNDRIIEGIRAAAGDEVDLTEWELGRHSLDNTSARLSAIEYVLGKSKYLPAHYREITASAVAKKCGARLDAALMMTSSEVRQLQCLGMTIGGHTVTHPILARIEDQQAKAEIAECKKALEALTGAAVPFFAFPNGIPGKDFLSQHVNYVREAGFRGAVTTAIGAVGHCCDPFQIPRFTPWRRDPVQFGYQLARNHSSRRQRQLSPP